MNNTSSIENENKVVRFVALMKATELKGEMLRFVDDVYALPIYRIVSEGVLKLSSGTMSKTRLDDNLYFDVTSLSPQFHKLYASKIMEVVVDTIIDEPEREISDPAGRITYVLPLNGKYANLGKSMIDELGDDYVELTSTEEGIRIEEVISSKGTNHLYLRIEPESLEPSTQKAISFDLIELYQKENGLFERSGLKKEAPLPTDEPPAVRFVALIPASKMKGEILKDIKDIYSLPVYTKVEDGVLKLSSGVQRKRDIYFDVTTLPAEFHEKYNSVIEEMTVKRIIGEQSKNTVVPAGRIIYLLPLDERYSTYNKTIIEELGKDFVKITVTGEGIKVDDLLKLGNTYENVYLRVHPEFFSEVASETVSSYLTELYQKENGLYETLSKNMTDNKDLK